MSTSDISSTSDFVMPNEPVVQKRVYEGNKYGEPPAKKWMPSIRVASGFQWNLQALAQAADAVESGAKSPVSALNELGVKVSYSVVRQGGPAHCPSFDVTVHDGPHTPMASHLHLLESDNDNYPLDHRIRAIHREELMKNLLKIYLLLKHFG